MDIQKINLDLKRKLLSLIKTNKISKILEQISDFYPKINYKLLKINIKFRSYYFKFIKEIKDKMHSVQTFLEHGFFLLDHFHIMYEVKPKIASIFSFLNIFF